MHYQLIITSTALQRYIQTAKHHFSADEESSTVNYNSAHELVAMLNEKLFRDLACLTSFIFISPHFPWNQLYH